MPSQLQTSLTCHTRPSQSQGSNGLSLVPGQRYWLDFVTTVSACTRTDKVETSCNFSLNFLLFWGLEINLSASTQLESQLSLWPEFYNNFFFFSIQLVSLLLWSVPIPAGPMKLMMARLKLFTVTVTVTHLLSSQSSVNSAILFCGFNLSTTANHALRVARPREMAGRRSSGLRKSSPTEQNWKAICAKELAGQGRVG